jgi:outer membrane receptor protein involved in Fe transport
LRTCVCALALASLLAAATARAQETIDSASVSGRVVDAQNAVVPGATVTLRQQDTNVPRTTQTNRDGRFRFTYLQIGNYELVAQLSGFADARRSLTLTAGAAFELTMTLSLATVDTQVTVTADAPVLETARTQIAATVQRSEVAAVPLNGRNFLDLALLAPGVSPSNTGTTQLFAETSAVPGGGLSVGSQRNFSNNFVLDGVSANDDAAGLSGTPVSVDAVEQFQVVTSGGQAQLGRALGGYFNVVTRSGTNAFFGDGFGYFRDSKLNADNALSHTRLPMDQQQLGGSAGGPLVRNETFFFANVERRNLDQTGLVTIAPAAVEAINAKLAATGYPGSSIATGPYANPVDTLNVLTKVDHAAGPRDQMSGRYLLYRAQSHNSRGAGGLAAATASADLANVDQALSFSNTATMSSSVVNETRMQFVRSNLDAPPSDPVGPAVAIAGVASFGTLSVSPTRRSNTLVELVDNVSRQFGAHALRAGADLIWNEDTITFPRATRGSYTFSSLARFLAGDYNNAGFTQAFGDASVSQTNPNIGLYAQDEWKVAPSFTLNAGLRYDLQFLHTIRTDTNNVAPRVGFAWAPSASGRTIVRGGAGLYFDRVPLRALANALLSANNTTDIGNLRQVIVSLSPAQAGAPVFPAILTAPQASVSLPNLTTMQRDMQNAYSQQANIEIEHEFGQRTTVSAALQYMRGQHLIVSINQNVPTCVAVGANNGCRPSSTYGNNSQYTSAASSDYEGLQLSVLRHASSWGQYRVSYTLSKAMSNVGEFFFSSPIDPFDLSKDWSRADDDQRHRLVISGSAAARGGWTDRSWGRLLRDLEISGTMRAYSSLPFNITSGLTTVQGTAARPVIDGAFIPRNAGDGPDFFTLDLRAGRSWRFRSGASLEGFVEAFNLTNHTNVVTVNGNFGAGAYPTNPSVSFGQPTAVSDPRVLQLAVRVKFGGR